MVLVFFGRWYNLYEEGIGELTFLRFLKYASGIMTFEKLAFDKASPPSFGKKEDGQKFYQNIDKTLNGIWDSLFPKTGKTSKETMEGMLVFKERQSRRRDAKREG